MTDASDFHRRSYDDANGDWSTGSIKGRISEGANVSDEQMREDICDRLMQMGPVDCTQIDVSVNNGVVQLEGSLPTEDFKQRVLDVVSTVAGTDQIESRLRVG
jgi:osmotically-inducible protein OsmY